MFFSFFLKRPFHMIRLFYDHRPSQIPRHPRRSLPQYLRPFPCRGGRRFEYLEDFPVHLLARLEAVTGRDAGPLVVVLMEYGPDFSGPDKDTFRVDRATGDPLEAHRSNFLHPVFYYFRRLPTGTGVWTSKCRPGRAHGSFRGFCGRGMVGLCRSYR